MSVTAGKVPIIHHTLVNAQEKLDSHKRGASFPTTARAGPYSASNTVTARAPRRRNHAGITLPNHMCEGVCVCVWVWGVVTSYSVCEKLTPSQIVAPAIAAAASA